ncbi:transient receptor potential cation channel subfamily M member-like 2 isoform X2 [Mytilus edulis]|uniref:transient receptor potential cation channel subfamily M member-like 2 isoform X2 n=1 Tax=Mytilus edulis TaxID=6550 RepID=UPI0039EE23A6
MTTIGYSNSMKYSKYFPNHQEYASKVYKDIPIKRGRKKQKRSKSVDAKREHSPKNTLLSIENQEHVDIPPKVNSEETHPEAITFASQTDGPIIMQACTQTVDQISHDMATQTDDEKVTDIQKKVLAETPQAPRLELMHPQQSSARDEQPSTNLSSEQWECLKKFGEPRIVVSVIGAYNERITTYEWADDVLLKKALKHVARYTGRCGFLFQEKNTNLVQSVISRGCHIKGLPQQYGYFSVNYSDRPKDQNKNDDQYEGDASHHLNDLLELEKHINTEGQVSFQESVKGSKMLSNIRVPVALLVLNGDLETLDHVVRAIYNDMSVVVVKGTGGAADLIALCLEDFSSLKRELPIMLNRRFTKGLFDKVQEVFKMIIEKDWMISIFDIKVDEHDSLWERITDGITRAWSFEEKHDEGILITEYLSLHGGDCISKYVANIDGLTSRELFAGCSLNEADGRENKINENVFVTAFHAGQIDIMEHMINKDKKILLSESTFGELWKQEIILGCNKNNVKLLQRVCPCNIEDSNAPKLIAEKLMKGLCFSKIGMITCCKRCRKPNDNDAENADASETVPTDETLQVAVLLNESERAATLWHQSENPMMTALLSSMYLTALANIQEQNFEENLQDEYNSHAKLFVSRAVHLLEKLFTDNERMAIHVLDNVCDVWDYRESPLHLGHQFNIEEFISHSSNQKDASKRFYSYNEATDNDVHSNQESENVASKSQSSQKQKLIKTNSVYSISISGWFSFIKDHWSRNKIETLTAPVTKIVFHLLFFITTLILFSFFLTRQLKADSINLLEFLIFIYMLGDLLEEIWSMIRPQKDCNWSPQRMFLHIFNIWNTLDFLCSTLYILGFCLHFLDSDLISHIRRIYSISLFVMFLRLLNCLLLSKRFGIIIIMMKEMLVDLMQYLLILIIFILAAGIVYNANVYPSSTVTDASAFEFSRLWTILKIPYWQVYGELFLDTLEGTDDSGCSDNATIWNNDPSVERCPTGDWITPVIAAVYMMLTNWLLLNIVIAMFSARFQEIRDNSEQKWRYYRHSVIIDFEDKIPSPLNFPFRIFSSVWYSTKYCSCCPCYNKPKADDNKDMLKKQQQFAKEIIAEERHQKKILKKQRKTEKHRKRT